MRRTALVLLSALVMALSVTSAAALDPVAKVIAQPSAPLKITSYSAKYQRGGGRYVAEGIQHAVQYQNISERPIEAVQIGLVSFDIWNEFLDRTGGVGTDALAPGATKAGTWVARALADFSFLTGVAYVGKVRFSDGEIWSADLDAVLTELRKIQEDFDATALKSKRPNPIP